MPDQQSVLKQLLQTQIQPRRKPPIEVYLANGMRACFDPQDVKMVMENANGESCQVCLSYREVLEVAMTYDEFLKAVGAEPDEIGTKKHAADGTIRSRA